MNMGQAITKVFKNYANFNGRARRSEFWFFQLFVYLVALGISVIIGAVDILLAMSTISLFYLAMIVPLFAVMFRRLHDTGKSGTYCLFMLIPFVGSILLIVWLCEDSQPGDNVYGANPKYVYKAQTAAAQAQVVMNSSYLGIQCLTGPLQGQTYHVTQNGISIGTDVGCTIRFPVGTPGVSHRHCEIRWQQGVPVLIDLGSSYGTILADGKRLPPHNPERIAAGTRFYVGGKTILLQVVNV